MNGRRKLPMNKHKHFALSLLAAAPLLAAAGPACAALVVNTGTPNGSPVGAFALDATDFHAGQVAFAQDVSLRSILAHVLGGSAGETFSLALYDDSAAHLPGHALYRATATFDADGWNGVSGLAGWTATAGTYWIGVELGAVDTLGASSATGALLDVGAPRPLARTAFDVGSGWQASTAPLSFGLQVDAQGAVPEPGSLPLLLAALGGMSLLTLRGRR